MYIIVLLPIHSQCIGERWVAVEHCFLLHLAGGVCKICSWHIFLEVNFIVYNNEINRCSH